jgi:hypothetical protein
LDERLGFTTRDLLQLEQRVVTRNGTTTHARKISRMAAPAPCRTAEPTRPPSTMQDHHLGYNAGLTIAQDVDIHECTAADTGQGSGQ